METVEPFVGRADLCRVLDALIDAVPSSGAASVILGEPGIGKTTLLRRLARRSAPRVLWVRGLEAESVLPYASAADLLYPLLCHLDAVPSAQRRALESALAVSDGAVSSRLAVCAGALGVLAAAGDAEPLVVLVDDLHWVDAESRQLLLFAARRLTSKRVVMILAARDEPGIEPATGGLPTVLLPGLASAECEELVHRLNLTVSTGRLRSVVGATGGNPLAVLESLARNEGDAGLDANESVSVGPRLERAWRRLLDRLPGRTRRALFLMAAARSPELSALPDLLTALGLSLDDLIAAEEQGLVVRDRGRIELRHPMLRHVLIDVTPLAVRVPTYRALAAASNRERSAWYLSMATLGPDEEIASLLEAIATELRSRGGHGTAGRMLHRGAELTPAQGPRARRLLAAATDALLAGDAARAEQWCLEASAMPAGSEFHAALAAVRATALTWMGHPAAAYDHLVGVSESIEHEAPNLAGELLLAAAMPASMTGDVGRVTQAARRGDLLLVVGGGAPSFNARVMSAVARITDGTDWEPALRRAVDALPVIEPVAEQQALAVLAQGHSWVERFDRARMLINQAVDVARQHGARQVLAYALAVRAELGIRIGRWTNATADADEAVRLADELQQRGSLGYSLVTQARIDACCGRRDLVEERVARSRREVGPYGIDCLLVYEPAALGLAALTDGDPQIAAEHLEAAWQAAERLGLANPGTVPFVPDLAEAHVRCGHPDRARELIAWLDERATVTGLAYPAIGAHRCRGLLAGEPEEAMAAFAAATALDGRCPMPFERARTLLCQGELLRRTRRPGAARMSLREAQRLFDGLGARPWAERAARELAASGARPWSPTTLPPKLEMLTPQELQIARMVAGGRNNVETAAALFVSRKTVEAHLTRIYRKFNVRSRSELAALITAHGPIGLHRAGIL
jgi:DNA-binding CsgD family transcriptional regulator